MQEERVVKTSQIRFGREKSRGLLCVRESDVVALCIADVHLSLNPPTARCAEKDWQEAQERQLKELLSLSQQHKCPILIAGDVWDKPQPNVEAINWALKLFHSHYYEIYGIPGQHDLKYHSYDDIKKTAYWTLVHSGIITNLDPNKSLEIIVKSYPIRIWGFPWSFPIKPCPDPKDMILEIGVGHFYCWKPEYGGFPGALEQGRVKNLWKKLKGYDVFITGDNHIAHETQGKSCFLYNCGTFFRRKMTERDSWPSIGLIHADGTVTRHQMDVSLDKFIGVGNTQIEAVDGLDDLVRELEEKTIDLAIDFRENLNRVMESKGVSRKIRSIVMGALEDK